MKYIKRLLVVILGLALTVIVWVQVESNSELFASDMVHLKCTTTEVGGNFSSQAFKDEYFKLRPVILGRLQKDWIKDRVILRWIGDVGESEDGLEPATVLSTGVTQYSGWNYVTNVQRTFNRSTLVYTREQKESRDSDLEWWKQRQCETIDKVVFEKQREIVVSRTKAAQKI